MTYVIANPHGSYTQFVRLLEVINFVANNITDNDNITTNVRYIFVATIETNTVTIVIADEKKFGIL